MQRPENGMVFVFGSNMAGRHGKGAALYARNYCGAIYSQFVGLQGESYAIPTKDAKLKSLDLKTIEFYIKQFVDYARVNKSTKFYLTPIGCGEAGYTTEVILPLFKKYGLPANVYLANTWAV